MLTANHPVPTQGEILQNEMTYSSTKKLNKRGGLLGKGHMEVKGLGRNVQEDGPFLAQALCHPFAK